VESGGITISRKNQRLNKALNVGAPYKDLSIQRGRYLGGSSNFWGGNCIPMDPVDFKDRESRAGSFWPYSFKVLEPFIERAQNLMGVDSSKFGEELLEKINLNTVDSSEFFDWKAWQFCDFPFRFGEKFHTELDQSENITVILNANLVDMYTSDNAGEVESALIKNLNGRVEMVKAADFVIACGGIENAKILLNMMAKGSLPEENTGGMIGKCFAEHPNATIGYLEGKNAAKLFEHHRIKYVNGGKEIKPGLGVNPKSQERYGIMNGIVSVWPIPKENSAVNRVKLILHLIRKKEFGLKFLINTFLILPGIVSLLPHVRHRLKGGVVNTPHRTDCFEVRLMSETVPNPDSKVYLDENSDAMGLKVAVLDWKLAKQDRDSFSAIANLVKCYFDRQDGVSMSLLEWVNDCDSDWTKFINSDGHYGHHMGTTKMGSNPQQSVVDENCKVHGMGNLYVAGSSVFPTFGFANPTLTIVALSLKLAGHLKEKWS